MAGIEAGGGLSALALAVGDDEELVDDEEDEDETAAIALLEKKAAAAEEAARLRIGATISCEETPEEDNAEPENLSGARPWGTVVETGLNVADDAYGGDLEGEGGEEEQVLSDPLESEFAAAEEFEPVVVSDEEEDANCNEQLEALQQPASFMSARSERPSDALRRLDQQLAAREASESHHLESMGEAEGADAHEDEGAVDETLVEPVAGIPGDASLGGCGDEAAAMEGEELGQEDEDNDATLLENLAAASGDPVAMEETVAASASEDGDTLQDDAYGGSLNDPTLGSAVTCDVYGGEVDGEEEDDNAEQGEEDEANPILDTTGNDKDGSGGPDTPTGGTGGSSNGGIGGSSSQGNGPGSTTAGDAPSVGGGRNGGDSQDQGSIDSIGSKQSGQIEKESMATHLTRCLAHVDKLQEEADVDWGDAADAASDDMCDSHVETPRDTLARKQVSKPAPGLSPADENEPGMPITQSLAPTDANDMRAGGDDIVTISDDEEEEATSGHRSSSSRPWAKANPRPKIATTGDEVCPQANLGSELDAHLTDVVKGRLTKAAKTLRTKAQAVTSNSKPAEKAWWVKKSGPEKKMTQTEMVKTLLDLVKREKGVLKAMNISPALKRLMPEVYDSFFQSLSECGGLQTLAKSANLVWSAESAKSGAIIRSADAAGAVDVGTAANTVAKPASSLATGAGTSAADSSCAVAENIKRPGVIKKSSVSQGSTLATAKDKKKPQPPPIPPPASTKAQYDGPREPPGPPPASCFVAKPDWVARSFPQRTLAPKRWKVPTPRTAAKKAIVPSAASGVAASKTSAPSALPKLRQQSQQAQQATKISRLPIRPMKASQNFGQSRNVKVAQWKWKAPQVPLQQGSFRGHASSQPRPVPPQPPVLQKITSGKQPWSPSLQTPAAPATATTSGVVTKCDNEGRPIDLTRIVVNFANVGATYGVTCEKRTQWKFSYEGVRRCVEYLVSKHNLKIIGVVFENFGDTKTVPRDIEALCESIQYTPRLTGQHHKSADDEMTIKCAYRRNCLFLDNDNYKDWISNLKDDSVRAWLQHCQDFLQMRYFFDSGLGTFDTLDGNINWSQVGDGPPAKKMRC